MRAVYFHLFLKTEQKKLAIKTPRGKGLARVANFSEQ